MRSCPRCLLLYHSKAEFCGLDGERLKETPQDPLIGVRIDRYILEERLGEGGMASVYRARHFELSTPYAVKLLHGEYASDKEFAERFRREARAAAEIDHPNVIKVLDFGTNSAGLTFMVMELLVGRTLDHVIDRERPIAAERVARIIKQVAAALSTAHGIGFVHRDVKPSNVMLVGEGREEQVKLLDFGLVQRWEHEMERSRDRLTRTGMTVGTPCYMAPERMRGDPATPASDLYGLGALLYEMLSGAPPFRGSLQEIVTKQVTEGPPPLATETGLEPLAFSLLEQEASKRPRSAAAVISAIDGLSLGSRQGPGAPHLKAPAERPPPQGGTEALDLVETPHFLGARIWFALVVAVGLGVAGYHLRQQDEPPAPEQPRVAEAFVAGEDVFALEPERLTQAPETVTATEPATVVEVFAPPETVTPSASARLPESVTPTASATPSASTMLPERATPLESPTPPIRTEPARPVRNEPRPVGRRRQSVGALAGDIDAALRGRGLSLRDLSDVARLSRLVERWQGARSVSDEREANVVAPLLIAEIERLRIDDALVKRKIQRLGRALATARKTLGSSRTKSLDNRYQSLRSFLSRGRLSDGDRNMALFSASRLERELGTVVVRSGG